MKVAVVTGPTGVVGTALVEKLVEKNVEVFAISRPNSKRMDTIIKNYLSAFDFLGLVYAPKKRKQQRNNKPADIGRIGFRKISCT